MSELDPDIRAFLDRTRDAGTPSPEARARVRRRLIAAGAAGGLSGLFAKSAAALGSSVTIKVIGGVAIAVALVGAPIWLATTPDPAPSNTRAQRGAPSAEPSSLAAGTATDAPDAPAPGAATEAPRADELEPNASPIDATTDVAEAPRRAPTRRPTSPAGRAQANEPSTDAAGDDAAGDDATGDDPASRDPRDTLQEEVALLARGVTALNRGDLDGARALLREHAARFPDSQLARERDEALLRAESNEDAP